MDSARLAKLARLAMILVAAALAPASARAGGLKPSDDWADASGYASPVLIPAAYPAAGAVVDPSGTLWCYAIPFQAVYQFPAAQANQPGAAVGWLQFNATPGLLGGRPYLYHP
jgi:hypothetical protein